MHKHFPQHLIIETTTRCNLRCKQCARVVDKYDLADLALDTFSRLKPLFPHVKEVALYGHGETFLHKHFFLMLEELKKHDIFVYVTTNGMLVNEDVAKRLVDLRLDRLSFSLDAATPELFNEIRRGADFDTIIKNIERLNAIKKRAGRDHAPTLSIMFCAMKSTIRDVPKLVRLADHLNMIHGVAVINIVEYGEAEGECILRYPDLAARYLQEANILAAQLAVPFDVPGTLEEFIHPVSLSLSQRIFRSYREFERSFNRWELFELKWSRYVQRVKSSPSHSHDTPPSPSHSSDTIRVRNCRDPWELMFVNVHGDVRACCVSHRIMGNVGEDDVLAIWQNERYQQFRQRLLSEDPPEECQTCPMRDWHVIPRERVTVQEGMFA